jgi:hypothetical protein
MAASSGHAEPNEFVLRGAGTELTLSRATLSGGWQLTYNGRTWPQPGQGLDFVEAGPLGGTATVTVEWIADAYRRTLTLLVPAVNLPVPDPAAGATTDCSTLAILTTTLERRIPQPGQQQTYEPVALTGTAGFNPIQT